MKLDVDTYEEIEADESATGQAALVVAIVAIVGGLLAGFAAPLGGGSFIGALLGQIIIVFAAWIIWAYVTYYVGSGIFGGKATTGQMLRVLGFAQAPLILGVIPLIGAFIGFIWTLACAFIAIRQGLDLDNTKAILTAIVAFVVVVIVNAIIILVLGLLGL
jgi:hypothetical protein